MVVIFLFAAFAFALVTTGVRGGCDTNVCCCPTPNSTIVAYESTYNGHYAVFAYNGGGPNSGSCSYSFTCTIPSEMDTECTLNEPGTSISARKDGNKVSISAEVGNCNADIVIVCTSGDCKTADKWSGKYIPSGSKGVAFPALCLLVAALSGLLF